MAHTFAHEPDASRYAMFDGTQLLGVVDYAENDSQIALTRSFTLPPFRGKGYAAKLMEFVASDLEANSTLRVVPSCWYAAQWFERNPDRAGLLSR